MIDHISIAVSDYARSKKFYQQVLATLGARLLMEPTPEQTIDGPYAAGFGRGQKPTFWIEPGEVGTHPHVAFTTDTRARVDAFYEAALAAGAPDNGPPGLRFYHPDYYGAFVLDPDGHKVEAVCHLPG